MPTTTGVTAVPSLHMVHEDWWTPQNEPQLQVINFQPGGGKTARTVAADRQTGDVYVAIVGH